MSKATPTAAYALYLFHTCAILGLGNGLEAASEVRIKVCPCERLL